MNINEEISAFLEEVQKNPRTLGELIAVYLDQSDLAQHNRLAERGCVGYENEADPKPVKAFTEDELKTRAAVAELKNLEKRGRAATALLDKLQFKCEHRVFADTPGYPYDVRNCRVCNGGMGLV